MGDTHSSKKILTTIVGLFIILMGLTALVVAQRAPQQFTVRFSQPGATTTWARPVNYHGKEGKSALELLKSHVHITTQQSSYGEYVDTIDGVQSGTDGKYWALYVNGKQTPVAANNYITHAGDTVEWKFE
jgi:CHASE1-domain containing sensor protein